MTAAIPTKAGEEFPGEPPAGFTPRRTSLRGLAITAVLMTVVLTILTGVIYPLAMVGISQVLFNHQANGSLIKVNGTIVGSSLIGQEFNTPKYFWDRLSAAGTGYNAESSGGTNLGPTNKKLLEATVAEANLIRKVNGLPKNYVLPSDAVSTSASGLDPDISPAYADLQTPRVARVRGLSLPIVMKLVRQNTAGRTLGILGEPRVNVLDLNLALDRLKK
jgi:potassium-transporting ATPase KdpC subunit